MPMVEAASAGFVKPCGTLFCLDGKTFNVAGTNNHYLGWGTQSEVDHVLNDAKAMNLNVVRTILHSVRGSLDGNQVNQGTMPLKWNWGSTADSSNMGMKGVYILYWDTSSKTMAWNDSTVDGLGRWDYVIWKAKQLGIKLDIALLDFWQWAGGVQQINANFKGGNYDISNASDRYSFFFTDSRTKQFYKSWVNHVPNRTNTLTGVKYRDDPTIFAWDLMNEPEMSSTSTGQSWISEMSAYVKTIDSNHMVASGNEGFADAHAGSSPQLEMTIRTIDFATWHTYPTYHHITTNDVVNLITANCQIATTGKKPVLVQEFGYPSDHSDQAGVYQSWVDTIQKNSNCAGWMFWRLEGIEQNGSYPPDNGEHLGVYNNNSITSQVFKNAAFKLISRNGSSPTTTPRPAPNPAATPRPANTPLPTSTPVSTARETFVMGINFNGPAVTIQGHNWLSYSSAKGQGLGVLGAITDTKLLPPQPACGCTDDFNAEYAHLCSQ
ncbi:MAG: beta-mannosidase [Chloroflexota bacterium]